MWIFNVGEVPVAGYHSIGASLAGKGYAVGIGTAQ
jgi:hypothetical protein